MIDLPCHGHCKKTGSEERPSGQKFWYNLVGKYQPSVLLCWNFFMPETGRKILAQLTGERDSRRTRLSSVCIRQEIKNTNWRDPVPAFDLKEIEKVEA